MWQRLPPFYVILLGLCNSLQLAAPSTHELNFIYTDYKGRIILAMWCKAISVVNELILIGIRNGYLHFPPFPELETVYRMNENLLHNDIKYKRFMFKALIIDPMVCLATAFILTHHLYFTPLSRLPPVPDISVQDTPHAAKRTPAFLWQLPKRRWETRG